MQWFEEQTGEGVVLKNERRTTELVRKQCEQLMRWSVSHPVLSPDGARKSIRFYGEFLKGASAVHPNGIPVNVDFERLDRKSPSVLPGISDAAAREPLHREIEDEGLLLGRCDCQQPQGDNFLRI